VTPTPAQQCTSGANQRRRAAAAIVPRPPRPLRPPLRCLPIRAARPSRRSPSTSPRECSHPRAASLAAAAAAAAVSEAPVAPAVPAQPFSVACISCSASTRYLDRASSLSLAQRGQSPARVMRPHPPLLSGGGRRQQPPDVMIFGSRGTRRAPAVRPYPCLPRRCRHFRRHFRAASGWLGAAGGGRRRRVLCVA
jgi:hypothetical protein